MSAQPTSPPPPPAPGSEPQFFDPKHLFVTSDLTLEQMSRMLRGRRGCSLGRLRHRSAEENWWDERRKYRDRIAQQALAEMEENALMIARRQLNDARGLQSVGRGLIAAATSAIARIPGGFNQLLGTNPTLSTILKTIEAGAEIMNASMAAERELLGDNVTTEPLEITFQLLEPQPAEIADAEIVEDTEKTAAALPPSQSHTNGSNANGKT